MRSVRTAIAFAPERPPTAGRSIEINFHFFAPLALIAPHRRRRHSMTASRCGGRSRNASHAAWQTAKTIAMQQHRAKSTSNHFHDSEMRSNIMIYNEKKPIAPHTRPCHPQPILLRFDCHERPSVNRGGGRKQGLDRWLLHPCPPDRTSAPHPVRAVGRGRGGSPPASRCGSPRAPLASRGAADQGSGARARA